MAATNVIDAKEAKLEDKEQTSDIIIDLYIGVFFDGTNNNKLQSAIGQKFRRNKIFKEHSKELKKKGCTNINDVLSKSRKEWEKENIFTRNELDKLYGSADIGTGDLETQILKEENSEYSWSSVNIDDDSSWIDRKVTKKTLEQLAEPEKKRGWGDKLLHPQWGLKASTSQASNLTNPAILSCLYKVSDPKEEQAEGECKEFHHSVYVEGSGADSTTNIASNIKGIKDSVIGLGFGVGPTGVAEKCKKAVRQINNIYNIYNSKPEVSEIRVHFDVFGFSRGATTARLFTYIVNPDDSLTLSKEDYKLFTGSEKRFLPKKKDDPNSKLTFREIRKLGIYDTVSSIGILRDPINDEMGKLIKLAEENEFENYNKSKFHDSNVDDFGLHSTNKAKDVLHICALDENRVNFSLVDIESSIGGNGTELFIPGCHTDIGGGASLGTDDLKIVNKEVIANKGEILTEAMETYDKAKEIYKSAKETMKSISETVKGVKDVLSGAGQCSTLAGCVTGAVSIVKGVAETLSGVTGSIDGLHETVKGMHDLLVEDEDIKVIEEIKNTSKDLEGISSRIPAESNEMKQSTGLIKEKSEQIIKKCDEITDTIKQMKEALDIDKQVEQVKQTVEKAKEAMSTAKEAIGKTKKTLDVIKSMDFDDIFSKKGAKALIDQVKDTFKTAKDAVSDASSVIKSSKKIYKNAKSVLDTAIKVFDGAKKFLGNGIDQHDQAFQEVMSGMEDVSKGTDSVLETAKTLHKEVKIPTDSFVEIEATAAAIKVHCLNAACDICADTSGLPAASGPSEENENLQAIKKDIQDIDTELGNVCNSVASLYKSMSGLSTVCEGIDSICHIRNSGITKAVSGAIKTYKSLESQYKAAINTYKVVAASSEKMGAAMLDTLSRVASDPGVIVDMVKGGIGKAGASIAKANASVQSFTTGIQHYSQNIGESLGSAVDKIKQGGKSLVNKIKDGFNKTCEDAKAYGSKIKETADMVVDIAKNGKLSHLIPEVIKKTVCFHHAYPCHRLMDDDLIPVNIKSMKDLGWVGKNIEETTNKTWMLGRAEQEEIDKGETVIIDGTKVFGYKGIDNVGIYKYTYPGYSNISLNLMHEWCNKEETLFNTVPPHYPVPSDLQRFYSGIKGKALGSKGRFFCVPKYYDEYRKLRCKYLHFSMNQRLVSPADNYIVNGPNFAFHLDKAVITRRIYIGKQNSGTAGDAKNAPGQVKYMYDYEGGNGQMVQLGCNVAEVEVTSRDS